MSAKSIAWYEDRIATYERLLGAECLAHARTRELAHELAGVLIDFNPDRQKDLSGRQDCALGRARIAGLL